MEYMYKIVHRLLPDEICNLFQLVRDQHTRQMRVSTGLDLVLPNPHLETSKKDIKYRGPLYWNMVDTDMRQIDNLCHLNLH